MPPTLTDIKARIPATDKAICDALGDDWCHPPQLKMLARMAEKIEPRHTALNAPEELKANLWLDEASNEAINEWLVLLKGWRELDTESVNLIRDKNARAFAHLVRLVTANAHRNWCYWITPLQVYERHKDE